MSDRHDTMPGEPSIVICGETLYHLLARTLKLMMQDASSSLRPQPQPSSHGHTGRTQTTDKYLQHFRSDHHILASCVVIKLSSFCPFSQRGLKTFLWRRKSDSDDISRYLSPGNVGIFLHLFNYSHLITSAVTDPRIIMRHISTPYPLAPSLLSVKNGEFDRNFL